MLKTAQFMLFFDFLVSEGCLGCSEQASKTLVKKKKFFFFLRFLKNRPILRPNLAGEFRRPKGPPLWKKNEIDQKRYPNISVFFGFHFVFFGFSGTRGNFPLRKKKKTKWTELHRIGPNS